MKLLNDCQNCIDNASTLYDFMSMAMEQINSINPDYVVLNDGINSNEKLIGFIEDINTGLFDSKIGDFYIFPEAKRVLKELINDIDFLDDKEPMSSILVLYAILRGIDSRFNYNSNHSELGPLDSDSNHRFRLYRRITPTLIDPFIIFSGKERTNGSAVCRSFNNYFFLDRRSWGEEKAIPFGIAVESPLDIGCKFFEPKPIRIGVSLFCSDRNFNFVSDDSKDLTVDYISKEQERFCAMVDKILDKAIYNGCDYLILPEYHTSQDVLDRIKKHIKIAYGNGHKTPILTFAGSQWTEDDSNQMIILGKDGSKLGLYNKFSPFRGEVKTSELMNRSGKHWTTDEIKVTEKLNNRDKNLVFFGINNLGMILPSICRDAYDDDYTQVLVQYLHPLFVFISAWSPSLKSFNSPLVNMCCRYFVSSVLDNACSARANDRGEVGYCNTVFKPDTVPEEMRADIKRPYSGCNHCDSGCLHIAEYNFGHHVDDGTERGSFIVPSLTVNCFVIDKESKDC